jgi:hypothetical protein
MVGSLLRCLFSYADNPEEIKAITQSTYATLYAAETNPGNMKKIIEDMVIREQMSEFDNELTQLLDNEKPTNDESDIDFLYRLDAASVLCVQITDNNHDSR